MGFKVRLLHGSSPFWIHMSCGGTCADCNDYDESVKAISDVLKMADAAESKVIAARGSVRKVLLENQAPTEWQEQVTARLEHLERELGEKNKVIADLKKKDMKEDRSPRLRRSRSPLKRVRAASSRRAATPSPRRSRRTRHGHSDDSRSPRRPRKSPESYDREREPLRRKRVTPGGASLKAATAKRGSKPPEPKGPPPEKSIDPPRTPPTPPPPKRSRSTHEEGTADPRKWLGQVRLRRRQRGWSQISEWSWRAS